VNAETVLKILKDNQVALQALGVSYLGLFGSISRDQGRPDSDVDLLVDFDDSFGLLKLARVQVFLERALGRNVDLVPRRLLRPELRAQILAEVLDAA
jgi:predicted nucleotidyltransferase